MQIIAQDRARYRKIRSVRKFQVAKDGCCTVSKTQTGRDGGKFIEHAARAAYASARIYESANFVKIEFAR